MKKIIKLGEFWILAMKNEKLAVFRDLEISGYF